MAPQYRVNSDELIQTLNAWDELIPGREKIHLIACGGTALTLLGYKETTADVDFLIPVENEYKRLVSFLKRAGYDPVGGYRWKRPEELLAFDLFVGKAVFTTNLLESPLEPNKNRKILELKKIYLGVLNPIDWMITKLFRGTQTDMDDCKILLANEKINVEELKERYKETAQYETGEEKVLRNLEVFLGRISQ